MNLNYNPGLGILIHVYLWTRILLRRLVWIWARNDFIPQVIVRCVHVSRLGGAGTHCPPSSRAHEPGGVMAMWNSTHRPGLFIRYVLIVIQVA